MAFNWYTSNGGGNSSLGDYIHLYVENYNKYGIYRTAKSLREENNSEVSSEGIDIESAYASLNKTKQQILSSVTKNANLSKINNFLTSMYRKEYDKADKIIQAGGSLEGIQKEYQDNLMAEIEKFLKPNQILDDDLSVHNLIGQAEDAGEKWSSYQKSKQGKMNKSTLLRMKEKLEKIIISNQNALNKLNGNNIKILNNNITEAEKILETIKQILEDIDKYLVPGQKNRLLPNFITTEKGNIDVKENLENGNPLAKAIISYNQLVKIHNVLDTISTGTAGETFGLFASAQAKFNVEKEERRLIVDELVNPLKGMSKRGGRVTGAEGSSNILVNINTELSDAFYKELEKDKKYTKKYTKNANGQIISVNPTQDTMDFTYTYEDDDNLYGTNQLNASMKNYENAFNRKISILGNTDFKTGETTGGTSLLQILQLLPISFGNHYLNLLVKINHDLDNNGSGSKSINPAADNIVKYAVAIRAFSGKRYNGFSNDKIVNYFIVMDRTSKSVRVLNVGNILEALSSSAGVFDDTLVNIPAFKGSLQQTIENTKCNTVAQRIVKILMEVHKIKLSLTINPEAFWGKMSV